MPKSKEDEASSNKDEQTFDWDDRHYRVRGLGKNTTFERLNINLWVRHGELFHVDTLDLYSARQRKGFIRHATSELEVAEDILKRDMGLLLQELERIQQEQLCVETEPASPPPITEEQREEALQWLNQSNLLNALSRDFEALGLVGETNNAIVAYLAATSRKMLDPLSVIIQSSSAAGKSRLMHTTLDLMPQKRFSRTPRLHLRRCTISVRTLSSIESSPSPKTLVQRMRAML